MEERSSSEKKKHPEGPQDSLSHTIYDRLLGRWFHTHRSRVIVGHAIIVFILIFSAALAAATIYLDINSDQLKGFGYVGIFILNLISTSTFFIPVPGLTAAGQALIVSEAPRLGAWQVGVIGGLGMALGEITAYVAGALGREVAQGREVGGPTWFRNALSKTARAINWLMLRYGMITLFALSAVPNPIFEIAGLTAGAVRMNFWRFLGAVTAGKILRGLALAYIGEFSIHFFGL
jgi:membrane protein YqaA with SNARE-associated domain